MFARRACLGVRTIAAVATIFTPPGTLAAPDALLLIIPSLAMVDFRKFAVMGNLRTRSVFSGAILLTLVRGRSNGRNSLVK
jgi:hypothetical protein